MSRQVVTYALYLIALTVSASGWKYWKGEHGKKLDEMLEKAQHDPEAFVVYDADNTIWQNDLEESLLPYLEMKNIITRDNIDPSLKLIPFKENESLFAYYYRLCAIDDKVCYPWIAQVFAGHTLDFLKKYVDELFHYNQSIPVSYWEDGKLSQHVIDPPRIYEAQRELITTLQKKGVIVYVITAAAEELVRMVVSDVNYRLNIPADRVIGVSMLLKNVRTNDLTTARKEIEDGNFSDDTFQESTYTEQELTPYLWSPATFYVGKVSAIMDYIDPIKRPLLVAGDSPNDHFMLLYSGGYRVWVDRKAKYTKLTKQAIKERKDREQKLKMKATADKNWIFVKPAELRSEVPPGKPGPQPAPFFKLWFKNWGSWWKRYQGRYSKVSRGFGH